MDKADHIVSELQYKVADLDHKVWAYRRDMASEFEKYAEALLRDVSKDVSETVAWTMAASMKSYKSLYPEGAPLILPYPMGISNAANNSTTIPLPTPIIRPPDDECKHASPESPHAREKEFQGVFTPSYLPLLDGTSRGRSSNSACSISTCSGQEKQNTTTMELAQVNTVIQTSRTSVLPSPNSSTPTRNNTDEASNASDLSDGGIPRRSALRNSTSSFKCQSPRRVRFDVAGQEVLPTSSPVASDSSLPLAITSPTFCSDEEAESEMIEDFEEPPSRRISSSQALRILSRNPLEDDGTIWTPVSAPPDGSASITLPKSRAIFLLGDQDESDETDVALKKSFHITKPTFPPELFDRDTSSDDDLPPLKRHDSHAVSSVDAVHTLDMADVTRPRGVNHSNIPPHQTFGHPDLQLSEDDLQELFPFDENAMHPQICMPLSTHQDDSEGEDADDDEEDFPMIQSRKPKSEPISTNSYLKSPTVPISTSPVIDAEPSNPSSKLGSHCHPFSLPIVRPEVHAQAAILGPLNTFVGSVDGRSGIDESNTTNFQAVARMKASSGGSEDIVCSLRAAGGPRSFTERMIIEDLIEEHRAGQNAAQVGGSLHNLGEAVRGRRGSRHAD